jgi:hypothetical protein
VDDVVEHALLAAVQVGSVLHVQAPEPPDPVQIWCPPHATGAP